VDRPQPPRRRVRRYAVVSEEAAYAIAVKFGPQIRTLAQRVRLYEEPLGAALLEAVDQLDAVGRQWLDDRRAEQATEEMPVGKKLTAQQAAALLEVSDRQVTKLVDAGVLLGRKTRGRWLIDEASVLAYRRRREERSA
jgi:excisionase family DNA binding protein